MGGLYSRVASIQENALCFLRCFRYQIHNQSNNFLHFQFVADYAEKSNVMSCLLAAAYAYVIYFL